jgi:hypothetical protein
MEWSYVNLASKLQHKDLEHYKSLEIASKILNCDPLSDILELKE